MNVRRSLARRGFLATVANLVVLGLAVSVLGSDGFDPFGVAPVALAAVALLLLFVTLPEAATLEGATTGRLAVLAFMHVVAAIVCVVALVGRWR